MLSGPSPSPSCQAAIERCTKRLQQAPQEYESSRCLFVASKIPSCAPLAKAKVHQLQKAHPSNHYLKLVNGHFYWSLEPTRAIEIYQQVAAEFHASQHSEGELIAQYNILILLQALDRTQSELHQQIEVIQELSTRATTSVAKARALAIVASYTNRWNLDLGKIYERLTGYPNAEILSFPYSVKREFLLARSKTADQLLDYPQARKDRELLAQEANANHDLETWARANFGIAQAQLAQLRLFPSQRRAQDTRGAIDRALDAAEQTNDIELIARSIQHLVEIRSFGAYDEQQLQELADLCVRLSSDHEQISAAAFCHISQSILHEDLHPGRSLQHALVAVHTLSGIGTLEEKIEAWKRLLYASWGQTSFQVSMQIAVVTLALLDELREIQQHPVNRRKIFASQTRVFDWLSAKLERRAQNDPHAHALAFLVQELARARVLADEMRASKANPHAAPSPSASPQLESAFLASVRSQSHRDLLNVDALDKIEQLVRAFSAAFSQSISAQQSHLAPLTAPTQQNSKTSIAPLHPSAAPARQLKASEALLAFSFSRHDDFLNTAPHHSWVSVITTQGHVVVELPFDHRMLRQQIDFLSGIRGLGHQAVEHKLLGRIRSAIFSPVIKHLGPEIKQLIIVHDGSLQNLPLSSLLPRYALSVNPSATTWSLLARSSPNHQRAKSLVLTDPKLSLSAPGLQKLREQCPELANKRARHPAQPLPQSRLETQLIKEHLDPHLTQLTGLHASPKNLRSTWSTQFNHLHLSAHTLSSFACPDTSALMLAPSTNNELGLLNAQMISELELTGALVVLGGCSTAEGTLLAGEGVLSLARSFLVAGAQAVVASIWPVEDREAKVFFEHFYAHLGQGHRVDEALKAAQHELKAKGFPNRAFAGYLVLGLGRHRVQPLEDFR